MELMGPDRQQIRQLMLECFTDCDLLERMLAESERSIRMNLFVPRDADLEIAVDAVLEHVPHHALLKAIIGFEETSPALLKCCQQNLRDTDPVALAERLESFAGSELADFAKTAGFVWENPGNGEGASIVKAAQAAKRLEDLADAVAKADRSQKRVEVRQFSLQEQLARQLRRKDKIRVDDLRDTTVAEMLQVTRAGVQKVMGAELESSPLVNATRRLKERCLDQKGGGDREKLALAAMWIGAVLDSTVERAALDETVGPLEAAWARVTARRFPMWAKVAAGVAGVVVAAVTYAYVCQPGEYVSLGTTPVYVFNDPANLKSQWVWTATANAQPEILPDSFGEDGGDAFRRLRLPDAGGSAMILSTKSLGGRHLFDFHSSFRIHCERPVREIGWILRTQDPRTDGYRFKLVFDNSKNTGFVPAKLSVYLGNANEARWTPVDTELYEYEPEKDWLRVEMEASQGVLRWRLSQDRPNCKNPESFPDYCEQLKTIKSTRICWQFEDSARSFRSGSLGILAPVGGYAWLDRVELNTKTDPTRRGKFVTGLQYLGDIFRGARRSAVNLLGNKEGQMAAARCADGG